MTDQMYACSYWDSGCSSCSSAVSGAIGAAGNCTPIPVGASINLSFLPVEDNVSPVDYWAAICPVGTATIYCTSGIGI